MTHRYEMKLMKYGTITYPVVIDTTTGKEVDVPVRTIEHVKGYVQWMNEEERAANKEACETF